MKSPDFTQYSILLVDDTPNNLDVLLEFLQAYGFNLRVALSGESALQRIHYDAPDIILLDVLLPGIDGFETCRQLKVDPTTSHIPIIFMTSLANAEDKVRGFEVGAVDYVTKPLQQAEVLARITTHLRQHDLAQNLHAQNQQLIHSSQVERGRLLQAVDEQRNQLRALATRLTDVQEQERRRLSRELHDEMGQALTAIRMNLAAIEKELSRKELPGQELPGQELLSTTSRPAAQRIQERLAEAAQLTDETLEQIRELSLDLRPSMLDDLGLIPTLHWYVGRFAKRMNIPVDFQVTGIEQEPRLSPFLETALYRILQETLTNIARHAAATHVRLSLAIEKSEGAERVKKEVVAIIEDDGRGFDPDVTLGQNHNGADNTTEKSGAGLLGIRERITLLDGTWHLSSTPGAGTLMLIRLPLIQDPLRQPDLDQPGSSQPSISSLTSEPGQVESNQLQPDSGLPRE